jgi:hypothetical protein
MDSAVPSYDRKPNGYGYRGVHRCICGAKSDNQDWFLPGDVITNSLLVHYIACHRGEVPNEEIVKLINTFAAIKGKNSVLDGLLARLLVIAANHKEQENKTKE